MKAPRAAGGRRTGSRPDNLCSRPWAELLEDRTLLSTLDFDSAVAPANLTWNGFAAATANQIRLTTSGANFSFRDAAETITLGANAVALGWTGSGTNIVSGPISSVQSLTIDGGAGHTAAAQLGVAAAISVPGGVSITHFTKIVVNGALTSTTGQITLAANIGSGDTLTVSANGSVQTAGTATLTSNGSLSDSGTIQATNQNVVLTAATTLDVPGSVNAGSGMALLTAPVVTLDEGSVVTGTGGVSLTADNLTIDTSATPATVDAGTATAAIAPLTAGTTINLGGANGVSTLGLTNAELGQVTAGTFTIGNANSGPVNITAAINVGTADLNVTTGANANITFQAAGSLTAGTNVALTVTPGGTGGVVGNNGATTNVTATNLALTAGSGGVGAANTLTANVTTLTGSSANTVNLTNTGALTVNSLTVAAGNLTLSTGNALTLSGTLSAPGTITLNATAGGVNQTAGAITSLNLLLTGAGTFSLNQAGNSVPTLAADLTGPLVFRTSGLLAVGFVGGTSGVTTHNNDVTLNTGSALTIGQNLAAGTGTITLNPTTNGVIETTGVVTGANLLLTGAGAFNMILAGNSVNTLAANVNGSINYQNSGALTVGTVGGTNGLTTNGNPVNVTAGGVNNTLTVNQPITAGNANVALIADNMTFNAAVSAGTQTVNLAPFTLTRAITLGTKPGGTLGLVAADLAQITAGLLRIGNLNQSNTGDLQVTAAVTSPAATLSLSTGGAITDAGGFRVTATSMALRAANGIGSAAPLFVSVSNLAFLNTTANDVQIADDTGLTFTAVDGLTQSDNFGGNTTITAASPITFATNFITAGNILAWAMETPTPSFDNVTVNAGVTVQSTGGNVTFQAGDDVVINATSTVQAAGNVTFASAFQDVDSEGIQTLNGNVTAGATGIVTLDLGGFGGATEGAGGAITGGSLLLLSTGPAGSFVLNSTLNNVGTLAANITGPLTYQNAGALTIGTVGSTSGITATTGPVTLTTGAGVSETGTAAIAAPSLLLLGTGPDTLTNANQVGTLAANLTGALSFTDAPALTIGQVGTTNGITATGTVTLTTGAGVSEGGTATIAAPSLLLLGTGPDTLTNANQVGTLAANLTGALSFADTPALTIGQVGTTNGITATGTVTLTTGAGVSEGGTAIITAPSLLLLGTGPDTLTNANQVGTLAANLTGALTFTDAPALTIGQVGATNGVTATGTVTLTTGAGAGESGTAAITAPGLLLLGTGPDTLTNANQVGTLAANLTGTLTFTDTPALTIGQLGATNGVTATGTVTLTTGAGVGESGTAALTAPNLLLLGTGPDTLTNGNQVGTLAANVTGAINFRDAIDLIVGTVGAVNGITTGGGNLTLTTSGSLTVNQNVNLGAGVLSLTVGVTATFNGAAITASAGTLTGSAGTNAVVMNYPNSTTFTISGANAGTITNGNLAIPAPGLVFSGFGSLTGGNGSDFFKFVNNGSLTGNVNGGGSAPTDTLDYSAYTPDVHVVITNKGTNHGLMGANTSGIQGTFDNIDAFIGNSHPSSSLCGPNFPNTWNITGLNSGTLTTNFNPIMITVPFNGFDSLLGGTSADAFVFQTAGQITFIDGRGHALAPTGFDSLDFSNVNAVQTVRLANVAGIDGYAGTSTVGFSGGGSFSNIDKIVGTATAAGNTLFGANLNTAWNVTATDAGVVIDQSGSAHALTFAAFGNLTGGSANDFFTTLVSSGRALDGQLDGGMGNNTLSLSDLTPFNPQQPNATPGGYYNAVLILNGSDATGFNGADGNFVRNPDNSVTFYSNLVFGGGFRGISNLNGGYAVNDPQKPNSLQGDGVGPNAFNVHSVPDPFYPAGQGGRPQGNLGGSLSDGMHGLFFSRFQTLVGGYTTAVAAGSFSNTFNVAGTPAGVVTNLFGNVANDLFQVGDPASLSMANIQGPVGISGQGRASGNPFTLTAMCSPTTVHSNTIERGDEVVFLDTGNTNAATYTLSPGVLMRTGASPVYFGNVQTVTLNGGNAQDTVNVEGTLDATNTFINGAGTGVYTFNVDGTGTTSNTVINGVSGANAITINSTGTGSVLQASAPGNVNSVSVINLNGYGQNSGIHLIGGRNFAQGASSTTFSVVLDPNNLNSVIQIEGQGGNETLLFFQDAAHTIQGFNTNVFAFRPTGNGGGTVNVITTGQPILCFANITSIPQQAFEVSSFLLPGQDSQGRPLFSISLSSSLAKPFSLNTAPFAPVLAQASPASPFGFSAPTVTLADVNGDGVPDLIVALGSGFVPLVTVFDGASLFSVNATTQPMTLAQFFAYGTNFAGGVYVAAGNITNKPNPLQPGVRYSPDIVTGAGQGGGSQVSIFEYNGSYNPNVFPGGGVAPLAIGGFNGSFFAYPNFYGGVRVAVGDTIGSGYDDIITAPGPGGSPVVNVYNGQAIAQGITDPNNNLRSSFFAYDPTFSGGVFVAAGAYEGPKSTHADILTGPGFSGGPNVKVFYGPSPAAVLESFFAFPLNTGGGLGGNAEYAGVGSVAFDDSLDNDGFLDIIVGSGLGQPAEARVFAGHGGDPNPANSPPRINADPGANAADLLADTFFSTLNGTTAFGTTNPLDPNIVRAAVNVGGFAVPRAQA